LIDAIEVARRARSQLGRGTKYDLGRGGWDPEALVAADAKGRCDCSGFVAWCVHECRHVSLRLYTDYLGNWVETSAMVRDAKSPFGMFQQVAWSAAKPGMVIVYGDSGDGHQGHCGIIVEVDSTGPTSVVHCSKGGFERHGDAIQETGVDHFASRGAIVAECASVRYA
jgi:cell wall-associated NlpC family hydrolase